MKQTILSAPPDITFPPAPNEPCDPTLGSILYHCARESNAQLLCYVLNFLFDPPEVEYEAPLFIGPMQWGEERPLRWSSEHLAEVHELDVWRTMRGYGFIDQAFAMYEVMQWPEPIWYGQREKPEYFHPWNRPLTEEERRELPKMYAKYYAKVGRTLSRADGCGEVLLFVADSIKQPVRDNTIKQCTTAEREEFYRLRVHMLTKWREHGDLTWRCDYGPDVRLLAENASRCVHGVLSFGWTTAGAFGENELIEARDPETGADILRGNCAGVMRSVGEKGADHSDLCQACGHWDKSGYGAFTEIPLILYPSEDQERWFRVRPKGSRKILSDRWGLATGTESVKSVSAAVVIEVPEVYSGVRRGKRVFDPPRVKMTALVGCLWEDKEGIRGSLKIPHWNGFQTRRSAQVAPLHFPTATACTIPLHLVRRARNPTILRGPLQEMAARRKQLADDFFGRALVSLAEYEDLRNGLRPQLEAELITTEEYLDLYQPPRNGVSFVPEVLRQSRPLGDDRGLPSEPQWLTQRNVATRYVKTLKPQGKPPADMYEGYGPKESRWCKTCLDYVHQVHDCTGVVTRKTSRVPQILTGCANGVEDHPEQVRLSRVAEFRREKRIRARRLYYLALSNERLSHVVDLRLRAQRAALWSLSVDDDNDSVDSELQAEIRMGAVDQNELLNGGKRVSTASSIGDKEDWSINVRQTWQGEAGNHAFSDKSSADRRQKLTRKRWKLEKKFSTIAHCANCGRRFAGRDGGVCCTFDCADELRDKKKSTRKKGN